MQKKALLGLIYFLTILTIAGCQKKPEVIPTIRLGHAPHDHHASLYVAAMNPDYFKGNGGIYLKEVTFKKEYELIEKEQILARLLIESSTGGKELVRKLDEKIFDMSFGGVPAILNYIDKGSAIHILAPANAEGAGFVMGVDSSITNWDDFLDYVKKQKSPVRIGYKTAVTVQNIIFETALQSAGISYSTSLDDQSVQVVLVNLHGAKNLIPALNDGLIDGFVIMQPFVSLAETSRVGKTIAYLEDLPPKGKWRGSPCCALAARDSFVQENPAAVEALTSLILRANGLIEKNPEKSAKQIAEWLGTSEEVEMNSIPTITFLTEFSDSWNNGVAFWVNSMVDAGRLDSLVKTAFQAGKLEEAIYDQQLYQKSLANGNSRR